MPTYKYLGRGGACVSLVNRTIGGESAREGRRGSSLVAIKMQGASRAGEQGEHPAT